MKIYYINLNIIFQEKLKFKSKQYRENSRPMLKTCNVANIFLKKITEDKDLNLRIVKAIKNKKILNLQKNYT